jgi:hypothetical protein
MNKRNGTCFEWLSFGARVLIKIVEGQIVPIKTAFGFKFATNSVAALMTNLYKISRFVKRNKCTLNILTLRPALKDPF